MSKTASLTYNGTLVPSSSTVLVSGSITAGTVNSTTANSILNFGGIQSAGKPAGKPISLRHSVRCGYYHGMIKIYQKLNRPMEHAKMHEVDPTNYLKYFSEHEIEVFTRIRQELADLFNNRYIEYKKMIAKEQGYTCPDIPNTNKYILK